MKLCRILFIATLFFSCGIVHAQTTDELKNKIDDRTSNIRQLEAEIKNYQGQIEDLGKQGDSLKKTLAELDLSKKKLESNLILTQDKIENTNLEIQQLSLQIDDKTNRIGDSRRVIAQSIASIAQTDSFSLIEKLLGAGTLAEAWNGAEELSDLQSGVRDRIHELQNVKTSLMDNKKKTEEKKAELVSLQTDLANQKTVLATTVKQQNDLLSATKNTESNYKEILATKQAQKDAFEKEVLELESALKLAVDPSKIPGAGNGILAWPLDRIVITQYFGNTPFASANPQVYNGKGHTGVDFAASIGTPVRAAKSGTVVGVANTDLVRGCYSYGKWVMIKHFDGLSTLYAHLSLQTVSIGDSVDAGQVIGYSGNTGYTTGPHLHFGVYATQGVQITKLVSSTNCRNATIPLADLKAYLNPLSYLPTK
jgi:murein DD-endopeptidase MepM/ murein hydrolase activator NlpD